MRPSIPASASELGLYRLLRGNPRALETSVRRFSRIGEHGLLWQGIALAGAVVDERRRSEWIHAWATIVAAFGANQVIKFAFGRRRPDLPDLPPLMHTISNRSYPSAHATTSAAGARVLSPLVGVPLQPLAVAMAYSRLYLGVHWPSDVVAGFALGTAIGEIAS